MTTIAHPELEGLKRYTFGWADSDVAYPLALQLRNLQSLVEIGVDRNTTVVSPPC
jgi:hypothetical protein